MQTAVILDALCKRPGLSDKRDLLADMVEDSILELKGMLNYPEDAILPDGCIPAVKDLTLMRFNLDGSEGVSSETFASGGSVSYRDGLPMSVRRAVNRYRRLKE